jgi:hypothetical protein
MHRPVEGAGTLASPKEEDRFDLVKSMLAWLAVSSLQKGVIWWVSHHREHHPVPGSAGRRPFAGPTRSLVGAHGLDLRTAKQ